MIRIGSIVLRVDDLQRQTEFWEAALGDVCPSGSGSTSSSRSVPGSSYSTWSGGCTSRRVGPAVSCQGVRGNGSARRVLWPCRPRTAFAPDGGLDWLRAENHGLGGRQGEEQDDSYLRPQVDQRERHHREDREGQGDEPGERRAVPEPPDDERLDTDRADEAPGTRIVQGSAGSRTARSSSPVRAA